jgi:uncharacterized protein YjbI with pentapeptide repeats
MANPEHLEIWEQGIEEWNRWIDEFEPGNPDLSNLDLCGRIIEHANFSYADLSNTDFSGSTLINGNFRRALLTDGTFSGATLRYVDFSQAMLNNVNFRHAELAFVNLWSAVLTNADFFHVEMIGTQISNADLSEVKNLESVKRYGPSTIGIDTIYKSRGKIPETFLRGCGVPEEFIVQIPDLVAAMQPIQFYSCFISYSSKEEEFARRLYADLQSEGVRCWFAPEDLMIGEKFRVRIDESIRMYDKLLLVLSENSVASQWVEKEVETAFEKEGEQGKTVLFPVQLDDAVTEIKTGWAADVRRSRHIGDFRDWKNHDSYRKAFERLMRDLKAEANR